MMVTNGRTNQIDGRINNHRLHGRKFKLIHEHKETGEYTEIEQDNRENRKSKKSTKNKRTDGKQPNERTTGK